MKPRVSSILKTYLAKRLFGYGPVDDYSQVDQFQGPAKDIKLLGMYSGVAYRCISTIAEAVAGQYEPYPYVSSTQGKKTTLNSHPFWNVLNNPNPSLTFYQLMEGSASFIEQFGEFFWYLVPGSVSGYTNGIKEIYLLRPDRVGIQLDKKTGEVMGYNYSIGNGNKRIPFTAEEIRHFKTLNPKNPYRGYAPLEAAVEYVITEQEVSRFTRNYFANNAQLGGILQVNGKISRENWNKFVRQWRERYAGVDNAGKVAMVRDSQVTWTPITSDIQNMQLDQLKQTTVEQILMMFRVPKGLFGMESGEGLGRASVETLEYIFAKWTIDNKLGRFDDFIESICQDYYSSAPCKVDHQNIVPSDKAFELEVYTAGVDRWISRKEIRDKDPDLANTRIDGTDELFISNAMLPIGDPMSSEQAASKGVSDKAPSETVETDKNLKVTLKSKKKEYETKEAFRQTLEQNYTKYIGKYKTAFNSVLEKQKQNVLDNLEHIGKGITDNLINNDDSNFQSKLTPVLTALIIEQGQLALEFSGDSAKYVISQSLRKAIEASTKKMASNFDDETIQELNDTLSEGLQNGESIGELSDRVSQTYDEAMGYRADRVARTEAQSASSGATLDAYRQNPSVTAMTWFANPGACEFCAEINGTTVGLEESFVSQGDSVDVTQEDGSIDTYQADYGDVETPPLHPNCSCTIVPETT